MPPTSPRPSQGISLMLSQARFARLLLASVSRCPDLFETVAGCCVDAIPRLASLGWGYVHLCRDAPDLFEAVAGCFVDAIPGSLRSAVTCICVEMPRPLRGRLRVLVDAIPRLAPLGWGYVHLFRDTPDFSEAVTGCCVDPIPRLASLGCYLHLCRDAPDLFEAVSGCCRGAIPRLAPFGWGLHLCRDVPDLFETVAGCFVDAIPRLAPLGWGYVHLCRDAPDLRGRHRVLRGCYPQARFARLGLRASLTRCPRPLRGRCRVLRRRYPQARYARLLLASLSRCPRPLRDRRRVLVVAIPRLAPFGWGYVHLCRDAPDLFEAVAGCFVELSPGSLRSAGVTCISDEMPRPLRGRHRVLVDAIPRLASLGWGYVHLLRDAPDLFEAVSGCCRGAIPRLAPFGWGLHLCRDVPDLFEVVSGCCRGAIPRLAPFGWGLHLCRDVPDLFETVAGCFVDAIPRLAPFGWGYVHL